ncbi:MAG: hypothetical protein GY772_14310 [bacterium]|nr:hypothetical protein [bacterium]
MRDEQLEQWLDMQRAALRRIYPTVADINVGLSRDDDLGRYTAWCSVGPELGADGCFGYGDSVAVAVEKMADKLRSYRDAEAQREQCAVDACSAAALVTTGDGRMCGEHAMQWLRSEALEADDAVGPCGVRS